MKQLKFNGWQRLWILTSMIYLLLIVILKWDAFPTSNDIYAEWYNALYLSSDMYGEYKTKNAETYRAERPYLSYKNLIALIENDRKANVSIYQCHLVQHQNPFCDLIPLPSQLRNKYEKQLYLLHFQQIQIIKTGFLLWIVPIILLYIAGLLMLWVYKGF